MVSSAEAVSLTPCLLVMIDTMKAEGSSVDQLRKERDEARAERDALQKQVAKLNYRVQHLKQHVPVPTHME